MTFERNLKMTKRLLETGQQDQQTLLEHQPEVERSGPNTRYTLADLIGSSPGLVEAKELPGRWPPGTTTSSSRGRPGIRAKRCLPRASIT